MSLSIIRVILCMSASGIVVFTVGGTFFFSSTFHIHVIFLWVSLFSSLFLHNFHGTSISIRTIRAQIYSSLFYVRSGSYAISFFYRLMLFFLHYFFAPWCFERMCSAEEMTGFKKNIHHRLMFSPCSVREE